LDGDKIHWDLGAIASSELKTLSLPFEKTKDFNPKAPAVFSAALKFSDQTVAEADPVTMWQGLPTLGTIQKAIPTAVPVVSPTATPAVSSGS
jgi:hypothetical protein